MLTWKSIFVLPNQKLTSWFGFLRIRKRPWKHSFLFQISLFYWKVKSFIFRETLVVLWWPMMVDSTLWLELCHGDMDVLKIIIQEFMQESLISLAGSTHTCLALYVHLLSSLKFQWIHNFVIIFKTFSLKKYMQISIIVSTWLKQK